MESQLKSELGEELFEACIQNKVHDVKTMVNHRISTSNSNSPSLFSSLIMVAADHNAPDIVAFALKHGAQVTDPVKNTIIQAGFLDCYRVLIDAKAIDLDYYVPWFGDALGLAVRDEKLDWVKFCLEHGANPDKNLLDEYKMSLAEAAENGNQETVELLIQYGAKVRGSGAIVLAGEFGQTDIVRFLLAKGADVNELGIEEPTDPRSKVGVGSALHKAIENNHVDTALFLIEEGADISLEDGKGRTSKELAETLANTELLEKIRNK